MNYQYHYNKLIQTRQPLIRNKSTGIYESHHILPKSLGGTNDKSNLILLTPREHYIAHWLLYKIHTGVHKARMAYAFFKMSQCNPNQHRVFNSSLYNYRKNIMIIACSGTNNPNYGKSAHSLESRQQMSIAKQGTNNPQYGKTPWNKGLTKETSVIIQQYSTKFKDNYRKEDHPLFNKKRSIETKQKISNSHLGKSKSEQHKLNLSIANLGKTLSAETRQKMSNSRKGRPTITLTCPHCNHTGKSSAMYRWHFNNCKFV